MGIKYRQIARYRPKDFIPIEAYPFKPGDKVRHWDVKTDEIIVRTWPFTRNPFYAGLHCYPLTLVEEEV